MKKLFLLLVFLFLIYFAIQFAFNYFGNGHEVTYDLKDGDTTISVDEKYIDNYKNEVSNYYFKVTVDGREFTFQTYYDFNKSSYILKGIKYYSDDEYSCILPIFKDNILIFDVMCLKNNVITYYHNIDGNDKLDQFVKNLPIKNYNVNNWEDVKENPITEGTVKLYRDNIVKNHFMGLTHYRGLYTISEDNTKSIYNLSIFAKDAYQRMIEDYTGNYYVTANYDSMGTISKFYITDIKHNKLDSIQTYYQISYNSYIQGVVGDSIYIFDIDNQIQYELNTKKENVLEVGNKQTKIRQYEKGTWIKVEVNDVIKYKPLFSYSDYTNTEYARADKEGNKLSGYYYFYKAVKDYYEVYRANIQDEAKLTYLFNTKSINEIIYVKDYVYFKEGNDIKYFSDQTGVKTLVTNSEYEFNKTLSYNVFESKK